MCDVTFTNEMMLNLPTANSVPTPELTTVQKNVIKNQNCQCSDEGPVFIFAEVTLSLNLTAMFTSPSINAFPRSTKQAEHIREGRGCSLRIKWGVRLYVKAC